MNTVYYDHRPQTFEDVGNGSVRYNYDIEEVEFPPQPGAEEGEEAVPRTEYRCRQVTVWKPLTSDRITEAVLSEFGGRRELKLINEFNAAKFGLISGLTPAEIASRLKAYKDYLVERGALKTAVNAACADAGIE